VLGKAIRRDDVKKSPINIVENSSAAKRGCRRGQRAAVNRWLLYTLVCIG
jgi:hypothetical protein